MGPGLGVPPNRDDSSLGTGRMSEDGKSSIAGPPREGSLDAPFRHPIAWQDEAYYDLAAVEAEMERQFDVCHTCRRCFNLCDSFPRLFDLIDESKTGELDSVPKSDYAKVDEACTLCDMCFLTKCPYVPPHPFDIDIPPDPALPRRQAESRPPGVRARTA